MQAFDTSPTYTSFIQPQHDESQNILSAVFHGHDHFYARQELDGIVYQMVPQPGHPGMDRVRDAENYGYLRGHFLPPSGHIRVAVSPETAVVDYVRAYLPSNENATRRNGEVSFSYAIRPKNSAVRLTHD